MKGAIFDFDGPIFDGRQAAASAIEITIERFADREGLGRPRLDHRLVPLYGPRRLMALLYAEFDPDRETLTEIRAAYERSLADREAATAVDRRVIETLKTLRAAGLQLAVLTSRKTRNLEDLLQRLGLGEYFTIAAGCDWGRAAKPDPEAVRAVARALGFEPHDLVLIGDSDLDFAAARGAGVRYYHCAWTGEPNGLAAIGAQEVLPSLESVVRLLGSEPSTGNGRCHDPRVLPRDLAEAIAAGALSFYGGAGISIASGIGGWKDHYKPIFDAVADQELADTFQLPEVAQMLAADPGRAQRLFNRFQESFARADHQPNAYHFAMQRSGAERIWTSNYDQLFETADVIGRFGRKIVGSNEELLQNFRNQQLVIKMNGDFNRAKYRSDLDWGVVFTQEQFDLMDVRAREIWRSFEDEYRNKSIIFAGVSFTDPGLRRVVALAASRIPGTRYRHFLLAKEDGDPATRYANGLQAANLERYHIDTLFFASFDAIAQFVQRVAVTAARPIVGFCGNADAEGDDAGERVLAGGVLTAEQMALLCDRLGRQLAAAGIRVTSGHGPFVGVPAVNAAFETNPKLARFYLRKRGGKKFERTAPAIVVGGGSYDDMRRQFLAELGLLIALGGYQVGESKSGTVAEIEAAMNLRIPVILVPQAGGDVGGFKDQFLARIDAAYGDARLIEAIRSANAAVWRLDPAGLLQLAAAGGFVELITSVLCAAMGAASYLPNATGRASAW